MEYMEYNEAGIQESIESARRYSEKIDSFDSAERVGRHLSPYAAGCCDLRGGMPAVRLVNSKGEEFYLVLTENDFLTFIESLLVTAQAFNDRNKNVQRH